MRVSYSTINGEFPGRRLKGAKRYEKLYHYTSFESFVRIWLNKTLRFSPVTEVNDIQEKIIEASINNLNQVEIAKRLIEIRKSYKQVSFTMDYDTYLKGCMSPMMWGLYAGKTRGVCIELDYNKIQFPHSCLKGIVSYKSILRKYHCISPELKSEDALIKFIRTNRKELFFTKHKCWAGENEYRVLSNECDYLNIENAISAVYLAYENSSELEMVCKLVGNAVPVKIFTHFFAPDNSAIPMLKNYSLNV